MLISSGDETEKNNDSRKSTFTRRGGNLTLAWRNLAKACFPGRPASKDIFWGIEADIQEN